MKNTNNFTQIGPSLCVQLNRNTQKDLLNKDQYSISFT